MLKKCFSKSKRKNGNESFSNAMKFFFTNNGNTNLENITLEKNAVLKNDRKKQLKFSISTICSAETTSRK